MAAMSPALPNPALELLLQRRSSHDLAAPAPGDDELALILRAALRVPDFRRLRPFRFFAARGEGRERLGQAMLRAASAAGKSEKVLDRAPLMPLRAPLVIVVAACHKPDEKVPAFEQQLSAACTILTMQLAARALGFGGIWRSGWMMYDRGFHRELGLGDEDQIVGFLYLGTPAADEEPELPEDNPDDFLTWL